MSDSNATLNSSRPAGGGDTQPIKPVKRAPRWRSTLFTVLGVLALLVLGVFGGYTSGIARRQAARSESISGQLMEQYQFALVDIQFGRYEAAKQRLEFVLQNDPTFPGAQDQYTQVLVLSTLPTPSPTPEPTSTPDLRGVETLYETAKQLIAAGDWQNALNTLDQLRKQDPNFHTAEVDGMYYFGLRNHGVSLIQNQGDLEGGIYQLTLAERFAPIDSTANGLREGARAYIQGISYFGINWQQAVNIFRSVAAGWPSMWDGNMNAAQRLRIALMRYGDELWARGDACGATEIYEEAKAFGELDDVSSKNANQAFQQCFPATEEPTAAPTVETPTGEPPTEPPTEAPTETPTTPAP